MRPRIVGGIAGWAAAVTPLIAVNVASLAGFFDFAGMAAAGALALLAGILLGGAIAGGMAGRPRGRHAGGPLAGAGAGGIAALLYGVTTLTLVLVTSAVDSAPPLLVDDLGGSIRIVVAMLFVAALMVAMALLAGAWSGRMQPARAHIPAVDGTAGRTPRQSGGYGRVATPVRSAGWDEAPGGQDAQHTRYDTRNGGDPRYTGSRPRAAQSTPAARRAGPAGRERDPRW